MVNNRPLKSENTKRLLDAHIAEYALVETGLRALNLDEEAERVAAAIEQARARRTYLESALMPHRISEQIEEIGPEKTLRSIWASQFDQLCTGIESGLGAWLEVGVELRAHADAEILLALNQCIARRISNDARSVLRSAQLYVPVSIDDVCTPQFFEPGDDSTTDYAAAALDALAAVEEPDLLPLAQQCSEVILRAVP